jgi:hypothetical protein
MASLISKVIETKNQIAKIKSVIIKWLFPIGVVVKSVKPGRKL